MPPAIQEAVEGVLPKTGDPADLRLWTGMALMGLGVACGAVMIGRRKKAQR